MNGKIRILRHRPGVDDGGYGDPLQKGIRMNREIFIEMSPMLVV